MLDSVEQQLYNSQAAMIAEGYQRFNRQMNSTEIQKAVSLDMVRLGYPLREVGTIPNNAGFAYQQPVSQAPVLKMFKVTLRDGTFYGNLQGENLAEINEFGAKYIRAFGKAEEIKPVTDKATDPTQQVESLRESFKVFGLTDEQAKIAAAAY